MADTKITVLTAITTVDPAVDVLPIVDVSDTTMAASGTTKKITSNQILGAGGTATLASATITGDLTVDTSTLKVDSTNNRVGVGTASPLTNLHVGSGTGLTGLGIGLSRGATANFFEAFDGTKSFIAGTDSANTAVKVGSLSNHSLFLVCNNINQLQIDPLGVFTFTDGAGGTRMTLNSTGLGIGVTPSAWNSAVPALQVKGVNGVYGAGSSELGLTQNNFYNASGQWIYGTTAAAGRYSISGGTHYWHTATSGTINTEITQFASAKMTLDVSGRLLVNTASVIGGSGDTLQIAGKTVAGTDYCGMYTGTSTTVYGSRYYHTSAVVGSITFTASATAYNTSSDYRLKESVAPLSGGLARVNALKPSIYKWKADGSSGEGFLVHELAEVVPLAVTGEKDAVNEDGSIKPQGVDLSKVVPILVAAIQELTAEVNALKNA